MGKCKHSAQVLQTDYSFWIDGVHLDYWFCCNCGERLYVGRDRRENPKAGREEFRKELEDLKRYERERNFHDYSDIIEKAERELAGRECPECGGGGEIIERRGLSKERVVYIHCGLCKGTGKDGDS
jgi:hypothetical protein